MTVRFTALGANPFFKAIYRILNRILIIIHQLDTPESPDNIIRIHCRVPFQQFGFDALVYDEGIVDLGIEGFIIIMQCVIKKEHRSIRI